MIAHSPQQCTLCMTTKHSPSLSLESFLSLTPFFTSMTIKHSFFPPFLGFIDLVGLSSYYKLGKVFTSFESPYMVCTCCVIWLEVQVVSIDTLECFLCFPLYWNYHIFGFWNKCNIFSLNFRKYFLSFLTSRIQN